MPADSQRHRAQDDREQEPDERGEATDAQKSPVPAGHCDRRDVNADCEVERVTERQQAGEPEEQVVAQRQPAEEQAERQQLERARCVQAVLEQVRDVDRQPRHERERNDDCDRNGEPLHAKLRESPRRSGDQHDAEQQNHAEVTEPRRGVVVRVLLDEPDDRSSPGRAANRAETADDDDDEGEDHERRSLLRVDASSSRACTARRRCQQRDHRSRRPA